HRPRCCKTKPSGEEKSSLKEMKFEVGLRRSTRNSRAQSRNSHLPQNCKIQSIQPLQSSSPLCRNQSDSTSNKPKLLQSSHSGCWINFATNDLRNLCPSLNSC